MKQGRFNDLTQLLDLFFAAANVAVRHVWLVLDLHHRNGRIDLWRQRYMDLILVTVDAVQQTKRLAINYIIPTMASKVARPMFT